MSRRILSVAAGLAVTGALAGGGALAHAATSQKPATPAHPAFPAAAQHRQAPNGADPCPNMGGDSYTPSGSSPSGV
jgi:hypothetical protein